LPLFSKEGYKGTFVLLKPITEGLHFIKDDLLEGGPSQPIRAKEVPLLRVNLDRKERQWNTVTH